jgi:uncharacterized protein (DUF2384 family)
MRLKPGCHSRRLGWIVKIPAELIETSEGAELVETYLMQIEYGIYV